MTYGTLSREQLENLFAKSRIVYAVLDPTACPKLTERLRTHECEYAILYEGLPPPDLLAHLPRLVRVRCPSSFCTELLDGGGNGWGVFLLPSDAHADVGAMAAHAARLCNVLTPSGGYAWLRWYEPYALGILLRECSREEQRLMYGDRVGVFVAEVDRTGQYRLYSPAPGFADSPAARRLRLTPALLQALDEGHYRLFLEELFHHCHQRFCPTAPFLAEEDKRRIEDFCEQAQQYGLADMASMTAFVELGFRTGWQCASSPEARAILAGERLYPDEALRRLETWCQEAGLLPRQV